MADLTKLTRQYVDAFHRRDLAAVSALFTEDFALEDPAGRFDGKATVLHYITPLLREADGLSFSARNIYVDDAANVSVIEFELTLSGKRLIGTDVIHWRGGLMCELRAFLYETHPVQ
jgi:ketosteroid isomerase-like protein